MPRIRIKSFRRGSRLEAVRAHAQSPRALLKAAGAVVEAGADEAFRDQGRPPGSWPERMVPNIAGIIVDLSGPSEAPKARRFEGRPAVHDTNRLSQDISTDVTGPRTAETGSGLPYSGTQNYGGESETLPMTPKFQRKLWRWLKTPAGEPWKGELGWMLNKKFTNQTITINVQARPFLEVTPEDVDEMAENLGAIITVSPDEVTR